MLKEGERQRVCEPFMNLPTLNSSTGSSGSRLLPGGHRGRQRGSVLSPCRSIAETARLPWQPLLSYPRAPVPSSQRRDQTCWPCRRTKAGGGGFAPSRTWLSDAGSAEVRGASRRTRRVRRLMGQRFTRVTADNLGEARRKTENVEWILFCLHRNS